MFIEETGKTGITTLVRPNMDIAARMTAGDQVDLSRRNGSLVVQTVGGDYIGEVEPRLGQRLIKLIDSGNEYVAAISALDDTSVRIIIREMFQHASQTGKLSFPPAVTESFRPYVKGRLLRHDEADDESFYEEADESEEWEHTAEAEESDVTIYDFAGGVESVGFTAAEDGEE
jgi:hypothetical protein